MNELIKVTKKAKLPIKLVLVSLILTALLGIIYVLESIYFGKVLDAATTTLANVKRTIFTIILITLTEYVFGVITTFTTSRASEIGIYNLRTSLAQKICSLKYSVFTKKSVGDILSRTMGDLNGISAFWTGIFLDMYRGIFTFATGFVVCLLISVKLTIVGFIFIPISYYAAYKSSAMIEKTTYKSRQSIGSMNSLAHNILSGIITLKSFSLEKIMKNKFHDSADKYVKAEKQVGKAFFMMEIIGALIYYGPDIAVVIIAGIMAIKGQITSGEYLTFTFTFGMVSNVLDILKNFVMQGRSSNAMAERVLDIYELEEEKSHVVKDIKYDGEDIISIKNLSFYYEDTKILDNINLDLKRGKKIALVGASGAGKSTLINILSGLYLPSDGEVLIKGLTVNEENIATIRNQISIVSQETFLFPKSIYENLLYGNRNATKEEVIECCKKADIHDFITKLPKGYDTFIGEKGVFLSGGQRQRIAIACAFLRNSEILIFDEPTSALDAETERNIQKSLDQLAKDKTTITVAHRLSTIKNADCIYVLDKGRIVESGKHDELIDKKGYYYNLYKKQLEEEEGDSVYA